MTSHPVSNGAHARSPNALAHETSPYLKQHAYNPVHWMPWSDEAWRKAREENKLVLVSIGYAACHWCHVMERESFEDSSIAALMNEHFICLKIDREERPDIDQVYIEAVQLLSGHAGWPLNCFCLPDGKPIYGGTYFPVTKWANLLERLQALWQEDPNALTEQAGKLTSALRRHEKAAEETGEAAGLPPRPELKEALREAVERAKLMFDRAEGGAQRAPKFPLPVNWRFLLRYAHAQKDAATLTQVKLTLDKMADGGIHDQIGGGFARYSVDGIWKVPHFEKMLYDNGQLLGLYAQGYAIFGNPYYRQVAENLVGFLQRDLQDASGLFYASLDADSEGVEGKYYVWTREEIDATLGDKATLFAAMHGVDARGLWEEENHILLRDGDEAGIAAKFGLSIDAMKAIDRESCAKLLALRQKRIPPGLDDKVLVSWNALAITGLVEAGLWLREKTWITIAEKAAQALLRDALQADGSLKRSRQHGRFAIPGFLEDFAHLAYALLLLHRATQDNSYARAAESLIRYALAHFSDKEGVFFFFTSDLDAPLVARKLDLQDNVLPSANGVMARCLWHLGELFEEPQWRSRAEAMVARLLPDIGGYVLAHGGWAETALEMAEDHATLRVLGPNAVQAAQPLAQRYLPHVTVVAQTANPLPCLQGVESDGRTLYVVCRDKVCLQPVTDAESAIPLL